MIAMSVNTSVLGYVWWEDGSFVGRENLGREADLTNPNIFCYYQTRGFLVISVIL